MQTVPIENLRFRDYVTFAALAFSIGFWVFMLFVSILSNIISRVRYNPSKKQSTPKGNNLPYVTILRPLCGLEYKLRENLESSFTQDYGRFEIIMSVASPTDNCIPIVQSLIAKYPNIDARLVIDPLQEGINPKVANLVKAYQEAKHNLVWVCDSNVVFENNCLSHSIPIIQDPTVGLVHNLPLGISARSFGAQLDATFLNTSHAKMYTVINALRLGPCIIGKSCLFRRSDLDDIGGISAFKDKLAEDQLIGTAMWNKGLSHVMTSDIAYNRLGSLSSSNYFLRRARWCRLRKYLVPAATLLEPFTESVLNGAVASLAFQYLFQIPPLKFFLGHMILWFLLDFQLVQTFSKVSSLGQTKRAFIASWIYREFTALPLFIYAIFGSSFNWRGRNYRITEGTRAISDEASDHSLFSSLFYHPIFSSLTNLILDKVDFAADKLINSHLNGDSRAEESPILDLSSCAPSTPPMESDSLYSGYSTFDSSSSVSSISSDVVTPQEFSILESEFDMK